MRIDLNSSIPDITLAPGESIWISLSNGRQIRIHDSGIWPAVLNVYDLDVSEPTIPTDTLKIDKSWVEHIDAQEDAA